MNNYIAVIDLGAGDNSKGSTTDFLARQNNKTLVVRFNGGPNAHHTVIDETGRCHIFASFGSGTMIPGVKTLVSRYCLFDPLCCENEELALQNIGISDAYSRLYLDERALIITPYHVLANRNLEQQRGRGKHGSTGLGIGVTVEHSLEYPEEALHAGDLLSGDLDKKFLDIRRNLETRYEIEFSEAFQSMIPSYIERYKHLAGRISIIGQSEVKKLLKTESVIFEGSQGVLLDENWGFSPHVTWSKCTGKNINLLLEECGITEKPFILGVMRCYSTRHGEGPFPSHDTKLDALLEEPHNSDDCYQGAFRRGWLDIPMLRYALRAMEADGSPVDALAVSHLDKLQLLDWWEIIHDYFGLDKLPGNIQEQENITEILKYKNWKKISFEKPENIISVISKELNLPIMIESYGPTWKHKIFNSEKISAANV